MNTYKTEKQNKNFLKLQNLCNAVNRRYKSGLNDDDQVSRMFKFESKINDARVVIGYDTYKALSVEDLKKLKEQNEIQEDKNGVKYFEFNMVNNGIYQGRYKCILPIVKPF